MFTTFLILSLALTLNNCKIPDTKILDFENEIMAHEPNRMGKQYWPYIGLVRFENKVCTSLEGYEGVCLTRRECGYLDGLHSGSCVSNGIGRCCLVYRTCGQSSPYNNTYFTSSNFPNTFNGDTVCTFTIEPCPGVSCQVRLDLLNFVLAQPNASGYCNDDSMVISGSAGPVPIICGENSGQHLYLTFVSNNSITITITTSDNVDLERSWNIKVMQIACDCPTSAPPGCLQYYTDLSNTVRSFNYGTQINGAILTLRDSDTGAIIDTISGTRQLANTNYGICVQMQPGYCSIQWAQSSDSTSFTVSGNTILADAMQGGLPNTPVVGDSCTTDFVVVPNPYYTSNNMAVNADRFCGNQFVTVYTSSKPFVLTVITNGDEKVTDTVYDQANRGFSLTYTQQPCRNSNSFFVLNG